MDGRYGSNQYQNSAPPGPDNKYYAPPQGQNYATPPPSSGPPTYNPSAQNMSYAPSNLPPPGPSSMMTPNGSNPNAMFASNFVRQDSPTYGTNQPPLIRHVSSNHMLAVGIKTPNESFANPQGMPPPMTMASPNSGTYSTMIQAGPPSPAYTHYPPSPPASAHGLPPTSGGYHPYSNPSHPPQGNYPPPQYFNDRNYAPPSYDPNQYQPPGPPTLHTGGVAGDSFYGQPPAYGQQPGFSPSPPIHHHGEGLPPLRTTSNDSLPPSPSRPKGRDGGNVKRVNSRIDPAQMPRPIRLADGILYQTNSGTTTSSGRKIPPTSCTNFKVVDTGTCSPRCMRITSTAPPATKDIAAMTAIPIAVTATPFAPPEGTEEPVPVVDAGENPPRCSRCRGYVNPHVQWTDGGNKWTCNLCAMVNTTPPNYYSSLDGVGLRLDRKQRPELTHGTVDFLVGKDFSIRQTQEPLYVYAVDISQRAVASGLTMAALTAIRNSIGLLKGVPDRIKVGILTFDRTIHFYQVKDESASDPVRVMIADSDDPFSALPYSSWLLPLMTRTSSLGILLDKIPELIPALQGFDRDGNMTKGHPGANIAPPSGGQSGVPYDEYAQTCPAAVIKAVQQALASTGGRLMLFTSFSSNVGFGKITTSRDTQSIYGTSAELGAYAFASTALATADARKASPEEKATLSAYVNLAMECSKTFVSVDVIVASESEYLFPDYALLSEVSEQTGGNFHVFTGSLLLEENIQRFQYQLQNMQQSLVGLEVMMKVRCSTGFRVEKFLGRGCYDEMLRDDFECHVAVNELEVASISTSSSYCCVLKHDGALKDDDKVYIQLAVLYTSASLFRRCVRVHNLVASATTSPQQVFRHADLDATVDVLMKVAIDKALKFPLTLEKEGPRAFLTESAIEILQKYRTNCSPDSSRGQLILPESLKLLPLYTLCALKHPALLDNFPGGDATKGNNSGRGIILHVRAYERAYELRRLRSLPANQLMNSLYPRLYSLHQLDDGDGELTQLLDGLTIVKMPPVVPTLSEILDSEGLYLLDDGGVLWLYIGRNVAPQKLEDIFGLPTPPSGIYEKPKTLTLNIGGSFEANKVAAIMQNLLQNNWCKQELRVIWAGETTGPDSTRFGLRLVEDSVYGNASYVDFLCKIHAKIQSKAT